MADYHNIIYFKDPGSLYVNLYVPSAVTWNHEGHAIEIEQETLFPEADSTTLTIRTTAKVAFDLKFRVPRWVKGMTVKVNGTPQNITCRPGTWALVSRTWASGDRVTIQLPMKLVLTPVDEQHPHRVAVMYGPVVLVRDQSPSLNLTGNDFSKSLIARSQPLEFSSPGQPSGAFIPFYKVGKGTPYNMYFDLQS